MLKLSSLGLFFSFVVFVSLVDYLIRLSRVPKEIKDIARQKIPAARRYIIVSRFTISIFYVLVLGLFFNYYALHQDEFFSDPLSLEVASICISSLVGSFLYISFFVVDRLLCLRLLKSSGLSEEQARVLTRSLVVASGGAYILLGMAAYVFPGG
jgi:hypothetical protein